MARVTLASVAKPLVGIDIGSSSIKLCEIDDERDGKRHLLRYAVQPLPAQTIVDGQILNTNVVVEALEMLFEKSKRRDVALRIGGHSTIVKKLSLPLMTPTELAEQIQWEAQQHIPYNVAEVQIDYQILRRREQHGQMDVLLVAAKREEVSDLVNLVQQAKLRPRVIDLDAFAMQNLYEVCYGEVAGTQSVVLVCVGATTTTINVLRDGTTAFTRDMAGGGEQITRQLMKSLGASFAEAEKLKQQASLPGKVSPEVQKTLGQAVDELAAEVQRLLDFYVATAGEVSVRAIFLTGGTAACTPFLQALQRRSGIEVQVLDGSRFAFPPGGVDTVHLTSQLPQLAIAMGLALRKERELPT